MAYLGVESVIQGDSAKCIDAAFRVHFPDATLIADLTWGNGRFWRDVGKRARVVGMDIDPANRTRPPHIQANYEHVPLGDQSVDVAVFDPPFMFGPRQAAMTKMFFYEGRGEKAAIPIAAPKNASDLYAQSLLAAGEMRRIARLGMVLKGQDLTTVGGRDSLLAMSGGVWWWSYDTVGMVHRMLNIWPTDMLIQVSPVPRMIDPRWKNQRHFRRRHSFYLIYRWAKEVNSERSEAG